jgi:hypothetical protein
LDSLFGYGGQVIFGKAFSMATFQSDGKLVGLDAASDTLVFYRFDERGFTDRSFGESGTAQGNRGILLLP